MRSHISAIALGFAAAFGLTACGGQTLAPLADLHSHTFGARFSESEAAKVKAEGMVLELYNRNTGTLAPDSFVREFGDYTAAAVLKAFIPVDDVNGARTALITAMERVDRWSEIMRTDGRTFYSSVTPVDRDGNAVAVSSDGKATEAGETRYIDVVSPQKIGETQTRLEVTVRAEDGRVVADVRNVIPVLAGFGPLAFPVMEVGGMTSHAEIYQYEGGALLYFATKGLARSERLAREIGTDALEASVVGTYNWVISTISR